MHKAKGIVESRICILARTVYDDNSQICDNCLIYMHILTYLRKPMKVSLNFLMLLSSSLLHHFHVCTYIQTVLRARTHHPVCILVPRLIPT